MKPKICPICDKKFMPMNNNQRYCSEECREEYRIGYLAEYKSEHRKKSPYRDKLDPLTRKSIEARDAGMTYGKYIQQQEQQKQNDGILQARYQKWKIKQQDPARQQDRKKGE